jgi:hypothetical protein
MTCTSERDAAFFAYMEYTEIDAVEIGAALARIDRARLNLITAQNKLAILVQRLNLYSNARWHAFYSQGLVTAADWKMFCEREQAHGYIEPIRTPVSHLRVVR